MNPMTRSHRPHRWGGRFSSTASAPIAPSSRTACRTSCGSESRSSKIIQSWIDLKMPEVMRIETTPHPIEYEMYYSV